MKHHEPPIWAARKPDGVTRTTATLRTNAPANCPFLVAPEALRPTDAELTHSLRGTSERPLSRSPDLYDGRPRLQLGAKVPIEGDFGNLGFSPFGQDWERPIRMTASSPKSQVRHEQYVRFIRISRDMEDNQVPFSTLGNRNNLPQFDLFTNENGLFRLCDCQKARDQAAFARCKN